MNKMDGFPATIHVAYNVNTESCIACLLYYKLVSLKKTRFFQIIHWQAYVDFEWTWEKVNLNIALRGNGN